VTALDWRGDWLQLEPLSARQVVELRRDTDRMFATYTEHTGPLWRPDNPEAFRANLARGRAAELALGRALGRTPARVRDPGARRPTRAEKLAPDIPPDLEVRACARRSWARLGTFPIDLPPLCLPFYVPKDRGREDRRFVLVGVDGTDDLRAYGWAFGREILEDGLAFSRGSYLDVTQLRSMRDLAELREAVA
jgi:hypothetical protein